MMKCKQNLEDFNMSDLAATHCGCGEERNGCGCENNGCGRSMCFGNDSCSCLLWILILMCACGGQNNGCGCGNGFGGGDCCWLIILILLLGNNGCGCGF